MPATAAKQAGLRLTWWEIAGGVVLPLLSAAAEIVVLHEDVVGPWLSWCYTPLGILALLASSRGTPNLKRRALVCGANLGSAAGALLIAADHFLYSYFFVRPFTLVTLVIPPLLSAAVNAHRAVKLWEPAMSWAQLLAGTLAVFAPPAAAQYAEAEWRTVITRQLVAADSATVSASVRALNNYPLRLGRFDNDVCQWVVIDRTDLWDGNAALTAQLTKMMGPDFHHCMPRDPHG
jgi:hypothetical protein